MTSHVLISYTALIQVIPRVTKMILELCFPNEPAMSEPEVAAHQVMGEK